MDLDLRSPRVMQAIAAGVVLLGFVADIRFVGMLVGIGLVATVAAGLVEATRRTTWMTEIGLLAVSALAFLIGRAGWGWVLACVAAGAAALAAAADVWIAPGYVRRPK